MAVYLIFKYGKRFRFAPSFNYVIFLNKRSLACLLHLLALPNKLVFLAIYVFVHSFKEFGSESKGYFQNQIF